MKYWILDLKNYMKKIYINIFWKEINNNFIFLFSAGLYKIYFFKSNII